ncbi:MAG TPA: carbon monoxide dehydrogenase subunit G [Quisquiliibacterium sp.]|nr:carbon monoxide dehydrogenase subunit G [Quisquiliibacterium sp.]
MQLTSQQALPATPQQAWDALNDIDLLKQSIPGCETITATSDTSYEVLVAAAIGPVKARFKSKLQLLDVVPPQSYTMQFDGQGGPAGFGKGTAKVRLEPAPDGTTVLHYDVNAQVGGKIAQVGSRLVDMAAQKIASDFFNNFTRVITEKYPPAPVAPTAEAAPAPAPAAAPSGFFARLWAALRRLFGLG